MLKKRRGGGGLSEAYRFRREQVAVDCLKQLLRRGALGFSVCCFSYFFKSVFRFLYQKTTVFWFGAHCGLWIFRFLAFGFRLSVVFVFRLLVLVSFRSVR